MKRVPHRQGWDSIVLEEAVDQVLVIEKWWVEARGRPVVQIQDARPVGMYNQAPQEPLQAPPAYRDGRSAAASDRALGQSFCVVVS